MSFKLQPLHATDSYKLGHRPQYPQGTTRVYSNLTPRSDARFDAPSWLHDGKMVWYGLQGGWKQITELWNENFFGESRQRVVRDYINRTGPFIGGSEMDTNHIEALHELGYLPIRLKALPEGSRVPMRVPVLTSINTEDDFGWITNYLETWLSNETWKPTTVATIAAAFRKLLEYYAEVTGAPKEFVLWQGHDFSCRGMSGMMDSAASGSGHLASFFGTDTLSALDWIEWAYGKGKFLGGSVPATEHSVMTMGGPEGELALMKRIITEVNPTGVVSMVSDSYDFWEIMTGGVGTLKADILARKPDALGFAKVVFRPDSGDPVLILTGQAEPGSHTDSMTPAQKGSTQCLWDVFGGTTTSKGYRTLDSHVGQIYGDSITLHRAWEILSRQRFNGFSSANQVFGIGSYTYNCLTRDVFGLAMKATYGVVNGEGREIYKDPKTGDGMKKSARGLLRVDLIDGKYVLKDRCTAEEEAGGELQTIWEDGKWVKTTTFDEVRERLWPGGWPA